MEKAKKAWEEAYDESQQLLIFRQGFKQWIEVSIIMVGILIVFCFILFLFFKNSAMIFIDVGLGLAGFYVLITAHEFGHALIAHIFHCKYKFDTSTLFYYPVINRPHDYLTVEVTWPDNFSHTKKLLVGIIPNVIIISVAVSLIFLGSWWFWMGVFTLIGSSIAIVLDIKAVS